MLDSVGLTAPEDPSSETIRVPVLRVFDGDGFLTRIDHPLQQTSLEVGIRLGFIDAPEMGQPGGLQAKEFLEGLIGGKWVELVVLTKMDTGGIVDRHHRIVAIPYLKSDFSRSAASEESVFKRYFRHLKGSKFRNVELEMVLNGWAWVLDRYGPDESYFEALEDAKRHRRGIWAFEANVHPWEFKKQSYQAKRLKAGQANPPDLFTAPSRSALCPQNNCSGRLVRRSGKHGPFLGCSNFPECRFTRSA